MTPDGPQRVIVLATSNVGKLAELRELLASLPVDLRLLADVVGPVEIPEPFATFRENAAHKALQAARLSNSWALAEDSGLTVERLNGRPGVYSARFAGKGTPDEERVQQLLRCLRGVSADGRQAAFHCCVALASPGGESVSDQEIRPTTAGGSVSDQEIRPTGVLKPSIVGEWQGRCDGVICERPRGTNGFGYDPVFVPSGETRTNAELSPPEKNALSHRGQAMRAFARDLPRLLDGCP